MRPEMVRAVYVSASAIVYAPSFTSVPNLVWA